MSACCPWRMLPMPHLLLVDDDEDILSLLTSFFRKHSDGEFDLLLAFAEHPQRVLTRDQLIDFARGSSHVAYDRSIDVQVSRLRYKLEADPKNPMLIRTVRNGGYLFAPAVSRG